MTARPVSVYLTLMQFVSPYQMLQPAERAWVDGAVREIETHADKHSRPVSWYLDNAADVPTPRDPHGFASRHTVQFALRERLTEISRELSDLTPWAVAREIKRIAMTTMHDFMNTDDPDNPYFDLSKAKPEHWSAVKSLELKRGGKTYGIQPDDLLTDVTSGTTIKIQLHDKLAASIKLLEAMGVLSDPAQMNQIRGDRVGQMIQQITSQDSVDEAAERYAAALGDGR